MNKRRRGEANSAGGVSLIRGLAAAEVGAGAGSVSDMDKIVRNLRKSSRSQGHSSSSSFRKVVVAPAEVSALSRLPAENREADVSPLTETVDTSSSSSSPSPEEESQPHSDENRGDNDASCLLPKAEEEEEDEMSRSTTAVAITGVSKMKKHARVRTADGRVFSRFRPQDDAAKKLAERQYHYPQQQQQQQRQHPLVAAKAAEEKLPPLFCGTQGMKRKRISERLSRREGVRWSTSFNLGKSILNRWRRRRSQHMIRRAGKGEVAADCNAHDDDDYEKYGQSSDDDNDDGTVVEEKRSRNSTRVCDTLAAKAERRADELSQLTKDFDVDTDSEAEEAEVVEENVSFTVAPVSCSQEDEERSHNGAAAAAAAAVARRLSPLQFRKRQTHSPVTLERFQRRNRRMENLLPDRWKLDLANEPSAHELVTCDKTPWEERVAELHRTVACRAQAHKKKGKAQVPSLLEEEEEEKEEDGRLSLGYYTGQYFAQALFGSAKSYESALTHPGLAEKKRAEQEHEDTLLLPILQHIQNRRRVEALLTICNLQILRLYDLFPTEEVVRILRDTACMIDVAGLQQDAPDKKEEEEEEEEKSSRQKQQLPLRLCIGETGWSVRMRIDFETLAAVINFIDARSKMRLD